MITLILIIAVLASSASYQKKPCTKDICPKNQRWVECELGFCAPKKCEDLGNPIACPDFVGPCAGGCVCIEGYLKNSEGVCIPQGKCPSCAGDRNATSGDGLYCGNLCSNYFENKSKFESCRNQAPLYNACRCRKGFVFDDIITGKCLAPKDCPTACNGDYYAVYQKCPSVCQATCANREKPEACIDVCNTNECVCRDGYILKDRNSKCMKIEDCPVPEDCDGDINAVRTDCASGCPLTCEVLNSEEEPMMCAAVCIKNGCACKESYVYSKKEKRCISESECRKSAQQKSEK